MKKPYTKPMVSFEDYALDMPIAAGCDPNYTAEGKDFAAQGWFTVPKNCEYDMDPSEIFNDDKLCYYTASSYIFTS